MTHIETKTFKSGNSVALRLPKALGIGADVAMRIERIGSTLTVVPATDPAEQKKRLMRLVAKLRTIGPVGEIGKREPIEFLDREGN